MSTFRSTSIKNHFLKPGPTILPRRKIITINEDKTLRSALSLLNTHSIMSCPVVQSKSGIYTGLVETAQMVKEVLVEGRGDMICGDYLAAQSQKDGAKLDNVPLYLLLEVLSHGQQRIPLLSASKDADMLPISNQISQTDAVLSLLRKTESGSESESHDFQLIAAQKVDEIELIDSKKHGGLVTVKSADSVSSALSLLLNTGHKNLPVLAMDEKTQKEEMVNIIGLRSFRSSLSADDLQLSVAEYLAKINRKQPRDGLLYCSPNVTIKQLMQRFMETGLHQFWLSKDKYPVACVDLTDIIRCFVSVTDDTIASLRLAEKKEADRRARLINGQ